MEQWINDAGKAAASVSAVLTLLTITLIRPVKRRVAARRTERQEQAKFRETVLKKLNGIEDDIADLQYKRLSQAHDFYTTQGWCPTSKKAQLCSMYKSYHSKGRNHLSAHYEQDILALEDKPRRTLPQ